MSVNIQIERPKVIWRQVAEQMRSKILKGELPEGTKLPSTAEIAAQSGADVKTVHRALTELVREGLITRARKIGTYVTDRHTKLTRIGIYLSSDIPIQTYSLFRHSLQSEIHKIAHTRGITTRLFVDQRPKAEQITPMAELEDAAREKDIQGLITSASDIHDHPWIPKIKVPIVALGAGPVSHIHWDIQNFIELSLAELKKQGCTTVGTIFPFRQSGHNNTYKFVFEQCEKLGLKTTEDWNIRVEENSTILEENYENYGYKAFEKLWSHSEKPNGIVLYPDVITRGVVLSILSKHVRVPEDVRIVMHKNDSFYFLCPLPVTYVVSNVKEAAETLINQLDNLYHSRPIESVNLKFTVQTL